MLRIGTRGSALARWQAQTVQGRLGADLPAELVIVETSGDRDRATALTQLQTPGFFTKELEQELLEGRVDVAVHSLKDLPTQSPEGLETVAILERGDPRDALLVRPDAHDPDQGVLPVKPKGRLGTGSNRRRAQARRLRPDLEILDLRGNVGTRVRKLREGQYDAILVAAAALIRLELDVADLVHVPLAPDVFVPAPGQAAVAVQMRSDDERRAAVRARLDHASTRAAITAERELMRRLEGGCQLPLGAHLAAADAGWRLLAAIAPPPVPGDLPDPSGPLLELSGPDPDTLVAAAFDRLAPHARRTLDGTTVVVTRAADRAADLAATLEARGATVLLRPAIEIWLSPADDEAREVLEQAIEYDWILFPSPNAVRGFGAALDDLWPNGPRLGAVGPSTAAELDAQGQAVDLVPVTSTGAALVEQFLAANPTPQRVLLPGGDHAREEVPRRLIAAGHQVTRVQVYENRAPARIEPLGEVEAPLLLFLSPSAVENFHAAVDIPADARLISIGPTTSAAIRAAGYEVFREADPHTVPGLLEAIP